MKDQSNGFIEPGYETLEKISEIMAKTREILGDTHECCELPIYGCASEDIKEKLDEIDKAVMEAYTVLDIASCMILRDLVRGQE